MFLLDDWQPTDVRIYVRAQREEDIASIADELNRVRPADRLSCASVVLVIDGPEPPATYATSDSRFADSVIVVRLFRVIHGPVVELTHNSAKLLTGLLPQEVRKQLLKLLGTAYSPQDANLLNRAPSLCDIQGLCAAALQLSSTVIHRSLPLYILTSIFSLPESDRELVELAAFLAVCTPSNFRAHWGVPWFCAASISSWFEAAQPLGSFTQSKMIAFRSKSLARLVLSVLWVVALPPDERSPTSEVLTVAADRWQTGFAAADSAPFPSKADTIIAVERMIASVAAIPQLTTGVLSDAS